MQNLLVLGIVFLSLFLVFMLILLFARRVRDPNVRRFKEIEKSSTEAVLEEIEEDVEKEKAHVSVKDATQKVFSSLGQITQPDKEKISRLKEHLIQAGYHRDEVAKTFIGFKILCTILFFIFFFYIGLLSNQSIGLILVLAGLIAMVGNNLPDIILGAMIRKRQAQIARGLPDALDLLVITVEAGLGLNAAIMKVSDDLVFSCPVLAQEFSRVNQDLRTGISREVALRNLSDRNKVEDLRIFIGALILADRLGTSIADTLRAQADSLRTRIRQKAEEQAAKAGIKMLLPLVLFILPALIIILMGPGLIAVLRVLKQ